MIKLEYAILFATKAHQGQKRKTENIDMIFHPFTVGMILKNCGMSDECVMAGILHDVPEDTVFTLDDVQDNFGEEVARIVEEVTENKNLEWENRKEEAIEKIKTASFEGKMVECADKISNLDTIVQSYKEHGEYNWECFNRPYPQQKWYYTEMYKAIIANTEYNPLFDRYKQVLDEVFK